MQSNQSRFTSAEVFAFTFCSTITLGVSMLPFAPMGYATRDPWLSLILAALPYVLLGLLLGVYHQRHDRAFFDMLKQRLYAPLYYTIMIYFLVSSIYFSIVLSSSMNLMVQKHYLTNTAPWVIYVPWFFIIGVSLYFGIQTIVTFLRLYIIFESITLIVMFVVSFWGEFEMLYISPLFTTNAVDIIRGSLTDFPFFGGMVSLLALIHLTHKDKKTWISIQMSILCIVVVYVLLCFAVIGTFGFEASRQMVSPVHRLIQSLTTYGQFQRLDLIFMLLWTTSYFKMTLVQLWFSTVIIKKIAQRVRSVTVIAPLLSLLFVMLLFRSHLFEFSSKWFQYNTIFYSSIVPIFLLGYLIWRNKRGRLG